MSTSPRLLDVLGAACGLVVFSPVMAAIAAAVWCEDRGPVIFRQERLGRDRRPFTMLKFRSMRDGRVTRVGRLIRATGLDELPQFVNILRGDMSAVGPRPLTADDVQRLGWTTPQHDFRWRSRPGLTGLAQLAHAGPARPALELDRAYVEHRSLLLDGQLIALSFAVNALGKARVRAMLSRFRLVSDARSQRDWEVPRDCHRQRRVPEETIAPMPSTHSTLRALQAEDVLSALRALRVRQPVKFSAFYSSQLGGIVTDPALMVLPFDDHMVHRGHGIFDTATLVGGKIYDLEAHLDRFTASAERSKLRLPGTRDEMRRIIVRTTAASGRQDGAIRYWLSSGPGSLDLSPAAGAEPGFFVMIFAGLSYPERWYTEGLRVMTTTYPIKPPLYAITKSTNYLPNVLMQMEAKQAGLDNGVFIDESGHVGESSNMNVAFVTRDGVFRHPTFDRILSGCTSLRLLELAHALEAQKLIAGVEVCHIPVADARAAREMMLLGSSVKVAPIVEWDGVRIHDGKPGPVAKALLGLLEEDMRTGGDRLTDVV